MWLGEQLIQIVFLLLFMTIEFITVKELIVENNGTLHNVLPFYLAISGGVATI